jgi:arginase family enzyme
MAVGRSWVWRWVTCNMTPAVFAQLDRLSQITDMIYVHIAMDVLDPREVMGHGNKVPNGPSSEQLAALFEAVFRRYPKHRRSGLRLYHLLTKAGSLCRR